MRKLADAAMSSALLRANSISLEKLFEGLIVISSPSAAVPNRVMVIPPVDIDERSLPKSLFCKSNAVQAFFVSEKTSFIGSGFSNPPPDATAEAVVLPILVGFCVDVKPTDVNISLPFKPSNVSPFLCWSFISCANFCAKLSRSLIVCSIVLEASIRPLSAPLVT